jgi:hypothetical protein
MRPERWWSVILSLGLFMALSPLSAQAGPNRAFARQPHRQAFTPPQPRAHTNGWNRQPHQRQQGHAYGWTGHNRQWQQPRAHANRWNSQPHRWPQPRGHAYGWNGQNRQWQQPRGNAYGWNGNQRQGDQHRNVYGRNDRQYQWQQPPIGGQYNNTGSSYNRAGHQLHPQSPNIAPNSSGYSHNTTIPAGETGARPSFRHPGASGNAPLPQDQSPSGVI